MEVMSAREAAIKWGISQRRVAILCSENRITDAQMVGNMWIIPQNAQKPADARSVKAEPTEEISRLVILEKTEINNVIHLNKKDTNKISSVAVTSVFCVVASIITAGVLSPAVASGKVNPFYEMTRSLTILGQARRFEAILSAGTTVGWFALFSLYLSVCGEMSERFAQGWGRKGILLAALTASALVLWNVKIPGWILLILSVILWLVVPLIAGLNSLRKKK